MDASQPPDPYLLEGLSSLGVEADDAELAVMNVAHATYWPAIASLLSLDLSAVAEEPQPDLSRPPR
ncbi:MAG TPA: hypothetical protein VKA89_12370 [Solirubrobacterales bacterium]|nr:hypothetical protein [Solirubrobacterales bacterium]